MGWTLLAFAIVQVAAWQCARGGGAWRLRAALARLGRPDGRSDTQLYATLGAPLLLRRADGDDDPGADIIGEWLETGRDGGWHVALAFAGARCIGVSARNFVPVAGAR